MHLWDQNSPITEVLIYKPDTCLNLNLEQFTRQARLICAGAIPIIMQELFLQLTLLVCNLYISNLDDPLLLAAVGEANTVYMTLGVWIFNCLNNGFLVIGSAAFGRKDHHALWIIYLRGVVINLTIFAFIGIVMLNFEHVWLAMQVKEDIIPLAAHYLKLAIPSLLFYSFFDMSRQYLNSYTKFHVPAIIQAICFALHLLISYLLIVICDFKLAGAAWALNINYLLCSIMIILYIICSLNKSQENTLVLKRNDLKIIFQKWIIYIKMVSQSGLSMYLDVVFFQLIIIMASWLSVEEIGAHVILASMYCPLSQGMGGIGISITNLISHHIGANEIAKAKQLISTGFILVELYSILLCLFFIYGQGFWVNYFTQNAKIKNYIQNAIYVVSFVALVDGLQMYIMGALRALHKQNIVSKYYFWNNIVIGQVLCAIFAYYYDLGVLGIWLGVGIAQMLNFIRFAYELKNANWESSSELIHSNLDDHMRQEDNFMLKQISGINPNVNETELQPQIM